MYGGYPDVPGLGFPEVGGDWMKYGGWANPQQAQQQQYESWLNTGIEAPGSEIGLFADPSIVKGTSGNAYGADSYLSQPGTGVVGGQTTPSTVGGGVYGAGQGLGSGGYYPTQPTGTGASAAPGYYAQTQPISQAQQQANAWNAQFGNQGQGQGQGNVNQPNPRTLFRTDIPISDPSAFQLPEWIDQALQYEYTTMPGAEGAMDPYLTVWAANPLSQGNQWVNFNTLGYAPTQAIGRDIQGLQGYGRGLTTMQDLLASVEDPYQALMTSFQEQQAQMQAAQEALLQQIADMAAGTQDIAAQAETIPEVQNTPTFLPPGFQSLPEEYYGYAATHPRRDENGY